MKRNLFSSALFLMLCPALIVAPGCKNSDSCTTERSVVVSFDSNGGSSVDPQNIPIGSTAEVPEEPVLAEFLFAGWYADEALSHLYLFDEPVNDHITLYADWEADLSFSISSAEDFAKFRDNVNHNRDFVAVNAILKADIDLAGMEWIPIGLDENSAFTGTFEGNGHTISNVKIDGEIDYSGLFGYVDGATISNVVLENSQVDVEGSSTLYAGALCGYVTGDVVITNCTVSGGVISATTSANHAFAGGVVGYVDSASITISASSNSSEISSTSASTSYAGGVIACAFADVTISESYNVGDVASITTSLASTTPYVGGVVGYVKGRVSLANSYNMGKVSSVADFVLSYAYSGGLIGYANAESTITSSYNAGEVIAPETFYYYAGGVIARAAGNSEIINTYYLDSCGGDDSNGGEPKTQEEMTSASFAAQLNDSGGSSWSYDSSLANRGFPILSSLTYL